MPGRYVFPGGRVDTEDRLLDYWLPRVDLAPSQMEARLGGSGLSSLQDVVGYAIAAVRETFEEAGVLLVRPSENSEREKSQPQPHQREEKGRFRVAVENSGFPIALSALRRWSHWITPKIRRRRYDTRFFLAPMPAEQQCRPDHQEAVAGIWMPPRDALLGNLRGEIPLSPPTLVTLKELLAFSDLDGLLHEAGQRPWGERRLPQLIPLREGALLLLPWDPCYGQHGKEVEWKVGREITAPEEPFSRLWFAGGIWRPIRI